MSLSYQTMILLPVTSKTFVSIAVVAALLVTVWVVQQMSHSEEGVTEDTGWNSPVLSSDQQHALQQRHKLSPVSLLRLHDTIIRTQHQIHLMDGGIETHRENRSKTRFSESSNVIMKSIGLSSCAPLMLKLLVGLIDSKSIGIVGLT